MPRKKRKLDQFLHQRKKNQEVVLVEKTQLSNRIFRALVAAGFTVLLGLLAFLSRPLSLHYAVGIATQFVVLMILGLMLLRRLDPASLDRPAAFNKFMLLLSVAVGVQQLVLHMQWSPFLIPVPLFAMVVSLAFGRGTALLSMLAFCFYVGLTSSRLDAIAFPEGSGPAAALSYPIDFPLTITLLAGALTSILGMRKVRKQSKPVVVGFLVGIVQGSVILSCEFVGYGFTFESLKESSAWRELLASPGWAFASGLICGGVVTSLLPPIEQFFNILTDRRLLDLADPSNELLRVLRERAPGTYQHTLGVAQLASNAAEAIKADRLLAEVGAYFHDVGKIFKPEYFVENMGEDKSIHERLRPSMSKMVIISHVKDGIELAREAKLPEKIVDMIPMHHGTTVVEYFYQKARREGNATEESPVDTEYRYPGAKPHFREAGILMLADMTEAIAKTISDPGPRTFRTMVHEQVHKRLLEGQLDESDLTLNDLRVVEDSFVRTLTNMYHSRIKYPDPEPDARPGGDEVSASGPAEKARR